jgi:hypothetical protein
MEPQRLGDANDREVTAMPVSREQMLEELRKAEQARDLLTDLQRRLAGGTSELEDLLTHLEQLAQSLSEADPIRLLIESAVGSARMRDSIKAASDVSRSRSAIEGEISTLRGPYKECGPGLTHRITGILKFFGSSDGEGHGRPNIREPDKAEVRRTPSMSFGGQGGSVS